MSSAEMLKIIVSGIVEGFMEWLPVNNASHMISVDEIIRLNQSDAFKDVLLVVTQLRAILTVVVMYFHKLNPLGLTKASRQKDATWALQVRITIVCVPVAILGLLLDDWVEAHLLNVYVVAAALTVHGVSFIVSENSSACTNPRFTKVGQISAKATFLVGMVQLLALIPGTSRSSSTILGVMTLGCFGAAAAEFSFFLGIPIMFGASLLKIVKYFLAGNTFTGPQTFYIIPGMLIALMVSTHSIRFPMGYVREHDFKFFGYYRIILSTIVLACFGITVLASQERKPEAQSQVKE